MIARLENRDVGALLNQAQANVQVARANLEQGRAELRNAELELNRARDLVDRKFLSRSAYDQALARYDRAKAGISGLKAAIGVAEANRRNAEVAVEQTIIRAPFDGVVLTKNANVGDVITTFSAAVDTKGAVVTMADMSTLEVEADVSESNLQKAKVGQPVEIQLDALPDMRFRGEVARIVPTVDRAKATVLVEGQVCRARRAGSPGNEREGDFPRAQPGGWRAGGTHRGSAVVHRHPGRAEVRARRGR